MWALWEDHVDHAGDERREEGEKGKWDRKVMEAFERGEERVRVKGTGSVKR